MPSEFAGHEDCCPDFLLSLAQKAGKRDGFGRQVFPNGDTYAGGAGLSHFSSAF